MTQITVYGTPMVLVVTTDAWYNKATYLRGAVVWDKRRLGSAGLSTAQHAVTDAFSDIQTQANDDGLTRWQRRRLVKRVMRGKSFGGIPRVPKRAPVSDAKLKASISAAEKIVAGYVR